LPQAVIRFSAATVLRLGQRPSMHFQEEEIHA
jgi:hypothetical protein